MLPLSWPFSYSRRCTASSSLPGGRLPTGHRCWPPPSSFVWVGYLRTSTHQYPIRGPCVSSCRTISLEQPPCRSSPPWSLSLSLYRQFRRALKKGFCLTGFAAPSDCFLLIAAYKCTYLLTSKKTVSGSVFLPVRNLWCMRPTNNCSAVQPFYQKTTVLLNCSKAKIVCTARGKRGRSVTLPLQKNPNIWRVNCLRMLGVLINNRLTATNHRWQSVVGVHQSAICSAGVT